MKRNSFITKVNLRTANTIASIALLVSTFVATRHCVFIYHQEKMPDELNNLR